MAALMFSSCESTNGPEAPQNEEYSELNGEAPPIKPHLPVPSAAALSWQEDGMAVLFSFTTGTFTATEWEDGQESPDVFNPVKFDARQWVRVAKQAGFKLVIAMAKHHDGFCMWQTNTTDYSVKNSKWRNGKGDVVKDIADACREEGVKFGVYLSPWDMHDTTYGTPAYNDIYLKQLEEVLTWYGPVTEVWFDGANVGGDFGLLHSFQWSKFYDLVKKHQPDALVAIMGPGIRWIGNELGYAEETEWSVQPSVSLFHGVQGKPVWFPSECDFSIRITWNYVEGEDYLARTPLQLEDYYFLSIGRNSNMLMSVPPAPEGLISDIDVNKLLNWKKRLDEIFEEDLALGQKVKATNVRGNDRDFGPKMAVDNRNDTYWATDDSILTASMEVNFAETQYVNVIKMEEGIKYGQRVEEYNVYAWLSEKWQKISNGTTIGRTKIDRIPKVKTDKIKFEITRSQAAPVIKTFSLYYDPQSRF